MVRIVFAIFLLGVPLAAAGTAATHPHAAWQATGAALAGRGDRGVGLLAGHGGRRAGGRRENALP